MTDDNVIQLPASQPDRTGEDTPEDLTRPGDESCEQPSRQQPNPLMRDGPDAPDAADIEDPSEQL